MAGMILGMALPTSVIADDSDMGMAQAAVGRIYTTRNINTDLASSSSEDGLLEPIDYCEGLSELPLDLNLPN